MLNHLNTKGIVARTIRQSSYMKAWLKQWPLLCWENILTSNTLLGCWLALVWSQTTVKHKVVVKHCFIEVLNRAWNKRMNKYIIKVKQDTLQRKWQDNEIQKLVTDKMKVNEMEVPYKWITFMGRNCVSNLINVNRMVSGTKSLCFTWFQWWGRYLD